MCITEKRQERVEVSREFVGGKLVKTSCDIMCGIAGNDKKQLAV